MSLNKSKGNMYPWVTHTWNPIKGKCHHHCSYCYVPYTRAQNYYKGKNYLSEDALRDPLGRSKVIFVGSMIDMFCEEIPNEWIGKVLSYCVAHPFNIYLFQSKNPARFSNFVFPSQSIFGTTIETNRQVGWLSKAPPPQERVEALKHIDMEKMISIEPIVDFDVDVVVQWINEIKPKFVSIGADSKNNNLPEPTASKVGQLVVELQKFTEVKKKPNLERLYRG